MKNQVILVLPESKEKLGQAAGIPTATIPLGLLYVGTALKKAGYEVKIIDSQVKDVEKEIRSVDLDNVLFVGFSVLTSYVESALRLSSIVKARNPNISVVWGGIHPTLMPEQTVKDPVVDYVVLEEGEETVVELADYLNKKSKKRKKLSDIKGLVYKEKGVVKRNPYREYVRLEDYSLPAWELFKIERYIHHYDLGGVRRERDFTVQAGRGCPYRCRFCVNTTLHKRMWRPVGVDTIIAEMEYLHKKYGVRHFFLNDENFFIRRDRVVDFCKKLIEKNMDVTWDTNCRVDYFNEKHLNNKVLELMRRSGCLALSFGIESGSQKILDLIKKDIVVKQAINAVRKCAEFGITPVVSFMSGLPSETEEDLHRTLDLILLMGRIAPTVSVHGPTPFRPYPGCELYELALKQGLLMPTALKGWAKMKVDKEGGFLPADVIPWIKNPSELKAICFYGMRAFLKSHKELPARILTRLSRFRLKHKVFWFPFEKFLTEKYIEFRFR